MCAPHHIATGQVLLTFDPAMQKFLLCECMVNSSPSEDRPSHWQKHAIATPWDLKPLTWLTAGWCQTWRLCPRSWSVAQYLTDSDLLPRQRSACRRCHWTETAILRVLCDVLTAVDASDSALLDGSVRVPRMRTSLSSRLHNYWHTVWSVKTCRCVFD